MNSQILRRRRRRRGMEMQKKERGNDEGRGEQRVNWRVTKRGDAEKVVCVPGVRATAVSGRPDSRSERLIMFILCWWGIVRRCSRHQLRIQLVDFRKKMINVTHK